MTRDEWVSFLSGKNPEITSEVLDDAVANYKFVPHALISLPILGAVYLRQNSIQNYINKKALVMEPWQIRELLRVHFGVYGLHTRLSNELAALFPQHYIHVCKGDERVLGYTMSYDAGMQDRQVYLPVERLLARLYPTVPSHLYKEMASAHYAELDPTLEILRGQAIVEVYKSGVASACMSKADSYFELGINPTHAYDMPNIGMAVLRNKQGLVESRCMVYEASETDKRFIRIYGDGASETMRRKLLANGYTQGTWLGARLKLIQRKGKVVLPYLDNSGGVVALVDGELRIVVRKEYELYTKIYGDGIFATTGASRGQITITPIETKSMQGTCCLTGKAYDLTKDTLSWYWNGSEVVLVFSDYLRKLEEPLENYCYYTSPSSSRPEVVLGRLNTPSFRHNGRLWLETASNREHLGMCQLDQTLYPNDKTWYKLDLCVETPNGYIKTLDAVTVIYYDNAVMQKYMHKSQLTKHHIVVRGAKTYADASTGLTIVKLISGRKAVVGYHDIAQTVDGEWGMTKELSSYVDSDAGLKLYFKSLAAMQAYLKAKALEAIIAANFVPSIIVYEVSKIWPSYRIGSMEDMQICNLRNRSGGPITDFLTTVVKAYDMKMAEANAIDYSL